MAEITEHVSGDRVYVHTHKADTAADLVGPMRQYVGREMLAHIADRGALKPCRITLDAVDGSAGTATFTFKGRQFTDGLFNVFGHRCTHVFNV